VLLQVLFSLNHDFTQECPKCQARHEEGVGCMRTPRISILQVAPCLCHFTQPHSLLFICTANRLEWTLTSTYPRNKGPGHMEDMVPSPKYFRGHLPITLPDHSSLGSHLLTLRPEFRQKPQVSHTAQPQGTWLPCPQRWVTLGTPVLETSLRSHTYLRKPSSVGWR
jgi:hypothetical protein